MYRHPSNYQLLYQTFGAPQRCPLGKFYPKFKACTPRAMPHVSWLCNTPQGSTSDGDSCRAQPQARGRRPASIFTHLPYALSSWHGILFLRRSFPAPNLPVPPLPHHDHMPEHRLAARAEEIFLNTRKQASTILPGKHCPPQPPSLVAPHLGPDQLRWCPRETSQTPPAPPKGAGSSPSPEGCIPSCLCPSPWAPAPSAAASGGREIHPETIQALVLQKPAQLQRSIWLVYQNSD